MSELTQTDAFAEYSAKLLNPRWATSAIVQKPQRAEVVVCLWQQFFKLQPSGGHRYEDFFWRWDVNEKGKKLFRQHLEQAHTKCLPVRLIMACVEDPECRAAIEAGKPAHRLRKTFDVRKNWLGNVVDFSDEKFVIDFQCEQQG